MGVTNVTIYTLSIENFKKSKVELAGVFALLHEDIDDYFQQGRYYGIRIIGDISRFPPDLRAKMANFTLNEGSHYTQWLNLCVAYTSRVEITDAIKQLQWGPRRDSFVLRMWMSLYWNLVSGLLHFLLLIYWLELQERFVWVTSWLGKQGFVLWFLFKSFGLQWIFGLCSRHLSFIREVSRRQTENVNCVWSEKNDKTNSIFRTWQWPWMKNQPLAEKQDKLESIGFCKIWLRKDMKNRICFCRRLNYKLTDGHW